MKRKFPLAAVMGAALFLAAPTGGRTEESSGSAVGIEARKQTGVQTPASTLPDPVPHFMLKDVFGRTIAPSELDRWIVVYALGTNKNVDEGVEWTKRLALDHISEEGVLYVLIGDTGNFNRVLQPMVNKTIKSQYQKNIDDLRSRLEAAGKTWNYKLEDRFIMLNDSKGKLLELFGVSGEKDTAHLIVLDENRRVAGHFTAYDDSVSAALGKTIAARKGAADKTIVMGRRKKAVWKRYALAGGLAWALTR